MDLQRAREILGVSEDTTLDELDERYIRLIKRQKNSSEFNQEEPERTEDLNEAYEIIKSEITGISRQQTSIKDSSRKEKIDHFFYYYKFHVIGGIIGIVLIIYIVTSMVNGNNNANIADHPPEEFNIIMMGNFSIEDVTPIQENLTNLYNDGTANFDFFFQPEEVTSQFDMGTIVKNQATLTQANPDVFIFDQHNYEIFVDDGTFIPLDDLQTDQTEQSKLYVAHLEDETTENLYGIEISDSKLFEGVEIEGNKIILISKGSNNIEEAKNFIQSLLQ